MSVAQVLKLERELSPIVTKNTAGRVGKSFLSLPLFSRCLYFNYMEFRDNSFDGVMVSMLRLFFFSTSQGV